MQITILILIVVNLLRDAPEGNPLNVPLRNTAEVTASQGLALFISLISQRDFMTTLDLTNVVYHTKAVRNAFPQATRVRWIFSNSCRFAEAVLSVAVSFVLIVQSTEVLPLFFNFTALYFISELDNIGFRLAIKGYVTEGVEQTAKQYKYADKIYGRRQAT